jgi:ATP-dependent Zn protease
MQNKIPDSNDTNIPLNDNDKDNKIDMNAKKSSNKVTVFMIILLICSFVVYYFNIGIDELQYGGEQKLHDTFQFEKTMINNIHQDVSVGPVPF